MGGVRLRYAGQRAIIKSGFKGRGGANQGPVEIPCRQRTLIRSVAAGTEKRRQVPEIILKQAFLTWKELKGFVIL